MAATALSPAAARARRRRRQRTRTYGLAFLFLSPWIAGFVLFLLYPMVASLYFSFTHYDLLNSPRWIGLANYKYMLENDPFFWQAVRNTAWMVVIGLPLRLFWALMTATLLTHEGQRAALLPHALLPADDGAAGGRGARVHLPAQPRPRAGQRRARAPRHPGAVVVLRPVLVEARARAALTLGRGRRDDHLPRRTARRAQTQIEAAKIDGANAVRRYWHVTLPSLSPVIFFTLVTGLIWTFQTFTEAYVAGNTTSGQKDTLGEPQGSLLFYAIWLYQQGFRYFNMGYASALAWVLFGATMLCTLVLIKSSERWVHVEGNQ